MSPGVWRFPQDRRLKRRKFTAVWRRRTPQLTAEHAEHALAINVVINTRRIAIGSQLLTNAEQTAVATQFPDGSPERHLYLVPTS
jgi:hypothetical protein